MKLPVFLSALVFSAALACSAAAYAPPPEPTNPQPLKIVIPNPELLKQQTVLPVQEPLLPWQQSAPAPGKLRRWVDALFPADIRHDRPVATSAFKPAFLHTLASSGNDVQLSALAPAAGSDTPGVHTPLIRLPDASSPIKKEIPAEAASEPVTMPETKKETVAPEVLPLPPKPKREPKPVAAKPDAQLEKAYAALASGSAREAVGMYQAVLSNNARNEDALFGLATSYHRLGDAEKARPLYNKLLAANPDKREAQVNYLALLAKQSPQEALEKLKKLQGKYPEYAPIPAQIAIIYDGQGKPEEAYKYMSQATELSPESLSYRYNMAILLDKNNKYEDAAKWYKQVVDGWRSDEVIPASLENIQQRLMFIGSNKP